MFVWERVKGCEEEEEEADRELVSGSADRSKRDSSRRSE
jgi:hypothetical protein